VTKPYEPPTSKAQVAGGYRDLGHCLGECGRPMVSERAWRRGHRPEGYAAHKCRGLCGACYRLMVKHGVPAKKPVQERVKPLPGRPREETLEEWEFLRADGVTVAEAARRMGMRTRALEKALERARARGDERGARHHRDLLRIRARAAANELAAPPMRSWRPREEILAEWVELRDQGLTLTEAAERMGMVRHSLENALNRARRAGDARGIRTPAERALTHRKAMEARRGRAC
jgi:predicted DNA-binding protein (UPF0251 family)